MGNTHKDKRNERSEKRRKAKIRKSEKATLWRNIQYRFILGRIKSKISRGRIEINGFGKYLYRFIFPTYVSLYVIHRLQDEGLEVHYDKTSNPGTFLLFAITC